MSTPLGVICGQLIPAVAMKKPEQYNHIGGLKEIKDDLFNMLLGEAIFGSVIILLIIIFFREKPPTPANRIGRIVVEKNYR